MSDGTLHLGDAWKPLTLDEARFRLNDWFSEGAAVKVEVFVTAAEVAHAVVTATGRLQHWRERFPQAVGSDPQGAVAWYPIGSGEGEPANIVKTSFNLSRLPAGSRVLALDDRIHVELADGIWLGVQRVTDALA